ncbi:MAG: SIMPL domain-containing protein [Deltaproteobacteria bacterium]
MKKLFFISIFCLCLIPSASFASDDEKNAKERTISVTASHEGEFPPDTVSLSIAVESASRKAAEASVLAAKKAEAVLTEIKKIIDKDDSIKTSSFGIFPVYEYDNMRKRDFVAGYRATNEVTIRTKKTGSAGEIIDASLKAGSSNISGIVFSISDHAKYCDSLISVASKKAEALAQSAAKAFGLKITGVKHIAPSCSGQGERQYPLDAVRNAGMEAQAQRTPVEPGETKVYATVSAEFYIAE